MNRLCSAALILMAAIAQGALADDAKSPLAESKTNTIGYPDVATARKELLARKDAQSHIEGNGWLVIEVPSELTIWTFTPETDPAYPAVVKRVVTHDADGESISMEVLCQASKSACDNLVRQFQQLNEQMKESLSHH